MVLRYAASLSICNVTIFSSLKGPVAVRLNSAIWAPHPSTYPISVQRVLMYVPDSHLILRSESLPPYSIRSIEKILLTLTVLDTADLTGGSWYISVVNSDSTSPSLASDTSEYVLKTHMYSFGSSCAISISFVARPIAITSTPDTLGSSVPMWPTLSVPIIFLTQKST